MDGSAEIPGNSEALSSAVSEFVAARRLGLSVDTLRRDRRLGQLGIPFVKYGTGKCGGVRYDLADLERFIESKKRRTLPRRVVEVRAPAASVVPGLPLIGPFEEIAEPVERIDPPAPRRPAYHRSPWEALAEAVMDEPEEEDPFATGRSTQRRGPAGYFSG